LFVFHIGVGIGIGIGIEKTVYMVGNPPAGSVDADTNTDPDT